jgi:hypothetical protein
LEIPRCEIHPVDRSGKIPLKDGQGTIFHRFDASNGKAQKIGESYFEREAALSVEVSTQRYFAGM